MNQGLSRIKLLEKYLHSKIVSYGNIKIKQACPDDSEIIDDRCINGVNVFTDV